MDRAELEAMPRARLQALAKEHGLKGNASTTAIIEGLLGLVAATSTVEAVAEEGEVLEVAMDVEASSSSSSSFAISVGVSCEAMIEGAWTANCTIVRINKKSARVSTAEGAEFTVKNEDIRAQPDQTKGGISINSDSDSSNSNSNSNSSSNSDSSSSSSRRSSKPRTSTTSNRRSSTQAESHEEEDNAFADLNINMEAYEQSAEEEQVDWLAACCGEDAPKPKAVVKDRKSTLAAASSSSTAAVNASKQPWNSTPYKGSKPSSKKDEPKAGDIRKKSFSNTPTKLTGPTIVPKMNKAALMMMEQRKQKMLEMKAREEADGKDAKKDAFIARPVTARVAPVAVVKKVVAVAARPVTAPAAMNIAPFKAKKMPNFSAMHGKVASTKDKENHAAPSTADPVPATTKPVSAKTIVVPTKSAAAKMGGFVKNGQDKRQSVMASKRGMVSSNSTGSSKPSAAPALPIGPHGPFSTLVA